MKDQESSPDRGRGADDEERERIGHLGVGSESALKRMKQWERVRAEMREAKGDGPAGVAQD